MTIRPKPVHQLNYNPVIITFIIKTLVLGVLMAFCDFHLHASEIHKVFPGIFSEDFYTTAGGLFLLFAVVGGYGIYKDCQTSKSIFVLGGILFSTWMATTLLFVDIFSVNGVSYGIDALIMVWIFVHSQIRNS